MSVIFAAAQTLLKASRAKDVHLLVAFKPPCMSRIANPVYTPERRWYESPQQTGQRLCEFLQGMLHVCVRASTHISPIRNHIRITELQALGASPLLSIPISNARTSRSTPESPIQSLSTWGKTPSVDSKQRRVCGKNIGHFPR